MKYTKNLINNLFSRTDLKILVLSLLFVSPFNSYSEVPEPSAKHEETNINKVSETESILSSPESLSQFSVNEGKNLSQAHGRIIFSAENSNLREEIFLLDIDQKKVLAIPNCKGKSSEPSFSPDGQKYIFVCTNSKGQVSLLENSIPDKLNKTDSKDEAISNNKILFTIEDNKFPFSTIQNPSYFGLTNKILFQGNESDTTSNFYTVDINSSELNKLTDLKGRNSSPSYSSVLNKIAYSTDRFWPGTDVCMFDLKTKSENCFLSGNQTYSQPKFSNSGKSILFVNGDASETDVKQYNIIDKKIKNISNLPGKESFPEWNREDNLVAFLSSIEAQKNQSILINSVDSNESEVLLSSRVFSIKKFSWSGFTNKDIEKFNLKKENSILEVKDITAPPNYTPPYINLSSGLKSH